MKKSLFVTLAVFGSILMATSIQSCYNDNEETLYGTNTTVCDTTSISFATTVSPLVISNCATSGCHNASTASAGANLSSYTTIKSYITSNKAYFLGSIKQTSGYSAMPKGGSKMTTCNVSKLESWINAGMPNN